jgi:hypothetical protein
MITIPQITSLKPHNLKSSPHNLSILRDPILFRHFQSELSRLKTSWLTPSTSNKFVIIDKLCVPPPADYERLA